MTAAKAISSSTLLEELQTSLATCLRRPEGVSLPVAILWTDADGQWRPLVETLRSAIPHFYSLGPYDPAVRTGPVIWLKCIVDRTLPEVSPPEGTVPILYLPGVDRQQLRAASDCPEPWQPLVELQYRGTVWTQRGGRDWSVEAFLTSEYALGLDVSLDTATRQAIQRALPLIAMEPLTSLRGRRLEAEDFDRLCIGDPVRDLLAWMSDPGSFQARCDAARWRSFCNVAVREFDLDPDKDGPAVAAAALREGGGKWDAIWNRFTEAPKVYRGISMLLTGTKSKTLFVAEGRDPAANAEQEAALRKDLDAVVTQPHHAACESVIALEADHSARRGWVWADLGESPLALVLEPLARLARLVKLTLGGDTLPTIVDAYVNEGWRCDRAAIDALAGVTSSGDSELIARVVRSLYGPWLDKSARHFQSLIGPNGTELRNLASGMAAEKETCLLFADGLRFDVAGLLQERLETRGVRVRLAHRVAPLPTVTATAKPLASPAYAAVRGDGAGDDFAPLVSATGQPATAVRLRELMSSAGVAVLGQEESRPPANMEYGGWTEIGQLDSLGHKIGIRLVREIEREVEAIADRVMTLIEAGWPRVKVITDHGWLLLPGGLPKVELPRFLTATRWSRCAVVQGESATTVPTHGWYWNQLVRIASPPGIGAFVSGAEYSHGGISAQECVVPELIVERGADRVRAEVTGVHWRGMRCRVLVDTNAPAAKVDLRLNWKQSGSSIVASIKDVGPNGEASLAVNDDSHEGSAAAVVVLDAAGQVLAHQATTVGDES